MNDLLQAVVLGVIEGVSEFLPISSTGHLLIAEHWLGARSELFNVAIQAGAILAALLVFWPRVMTLLHGFNSPEFFDRALFGSFISLLRERAVLGIDAASCLVFDEVLVRVAQDAEIVLSEQIRHSILQVTHG